MTHSAESEKTFWRLRENIETGRRTEGDHFTVHADVATLAPVQNRSAANNAASLPINLPARSFRRNHHRLPPTAIVDLPFTIDPIRATSISSTWTLKSRSTVTTWFGATRNQSSELSVNLSDEMMIVFSALLQFEKLQTPLPQWYFPPCEW